MYIVYIHSSACLPMVGKQKILSLQMELDQSILSADFDMAVSEMVYF